MDDAGLFEVTDHNRQATSELALSLKVQLILNSSPAVHGNVLQQLADARGFSSDTVRLPPTIKKYSWVRREHQSNKKIILTIMVLPAPPWSDRDDIRFTNIYSVGIASSSSV